MKILGLSFDADGCLYHKSYLFAVMLTQLSSLSSKKQRILYKKILLEENRDFLQWIKKYVNQYDLAFTYVGSYRQSYSLDLASAAPRKRKHPRDDQTEELSKDIIKRYQLPNESLQIISDESFMATTDFFFNSIPFFNSMAIFTIK